jgi:hypothetical protein
VATVKELSSGRQERIALTDLVEHLAAAPSADGGRP